MSELDHNEVVGWVRPYGSLHAVIALRSGHEHRELAARFPLSLDIARAAGAEVREVTVPGRGALRPLLSLVTIGDFAHLLRRTSPRLRDPTPVEGQGSQGGLGRHDLD